MPISGHLPVVARGDGSRLPRVNPGLALFVLLFCVAFWLGVVLLVAYLT